MASLKETTFAEYRAAQQKYEAAQAAVGEELHKAPADYSPARYEALMSTAADTDRAATAIAHRIIASYGPEALVEAGRPV